MGDSYQGFNQFLTKVICLGEEGKWGFNDWWGGWEMIEEVSLFDV